ncbi:MAG TPA: WecB/TagA/CpsF family glycosyltransferase [Solirubrobacteraceae bacterium]|nr:WecB/TagA/CpsF family glycosyltransferase [Solirubrobacteraceae bacterium]
MSATAPWTLVGMTLDAKEASVGRVDELGSARAERRIGTGLLTIADGNLLTRARPRREISSVTIPTLRILDVEISTLTGDQALNAIAGWAERGTCQTLSYVNAHTLNLAARVEALHRSLRRSRLVMNDGVGLNLAARMRGERFPENLNGSDFTVRLLQLAAARDWNVYFLGGEPGVAELAAERLEQRIHDLCVVGVTHGYTRESDEVLAERVRDSGASLLVVALGSPLQEIWLDQNLEATGALIGIGVGAFLDFTAGRVRRAPRWMNTMGIEWCFRLLQEPGRLWRRYLVGNPLFLLRAWRDAFE